MRHVARTRITQRDGEYIVLAYDQHGSRLQEADYFTSDRDDAVRTAKEMIRKPGDFKGK